MDLYQILKHAVRYILDTPGLLLFVFLMLSTSFYLRPFREIFPGIADGVFSRGADGLALLTSATGLGAIIGCLFVANMKSTKGVVRLMYTFLIIDVILQIFLVFCWNFTLALTCVALMGFAVTTAGISGQVLLQSCVQEERRGRVKSLRGIIMRGDTYGSIFLGSLVSLLGYEAGLLIIAILFVYFYSNSQWAGYRTKALPSRINLINQILLYQPPLQSFTTNTSPGFISFGRILPTFPRATFSDLKT